jgi:hypothetical protein
MTPLNPTELIGRVLLVAFTDLTGSDQRTLDVILWLAAMTVLLCVLRDLLAARRVEPPKIDSSPVTWRQETVHTSANADALRQVVERLHADLASLASHRHGLVVANAPTVPIAQALGGLIDALLVATREIGILLGSNGGAR